MFTWGIKEEDGGELNDVMAWRCTQGKIMCSPN
jgi:hypothetical protein